MSGRTILETRVGEPRPIWVEITRVADGEVRWWLGHGLFGGEWAIDADQFEDGVWSDGNNACDCNRSLMFQEAGGVPYAERQHEACGSEAYRVRVWDEGRVTVLYEDDTEVG